MPRYPEPHRGGCQIDTGHLRMGASTSLKLRAKDKPPPLSPSTNKVPGLATGERSWGPVAIQLIGMPAEFWSWTQEDWTPAPLREGESPVKTANAREDGLRSSTFLKCRSAQANPRRSDRGNGRKEAELPSHQKGKEPDSSARPLSCVSGHAL